MTKRKVSVLHGNRLVRAVRELADKATHRLWIASPFVGGWSGNVRRVLGTNWQRHCDVRLLTDIQCKGIVASTAEQFFRRGLVRTLIGLHAKIYVFDDTALVTSANLTGTAFAKRYELGCLLSGTNARETIARFEDWWDRATAVKPEDIRYSPKSGPDPDGFGAALSTLWELPHECGDSPLPADRFGDYDSFCQHFDDLAATYARHQRLWRRVPVAYEVDAFLAYLYLHGKRPSAAYGSKVRDLSPRERESTVKKLAASFARDLHAGAVVNEGPQWRLQRSRDVRRLLHANKRIGLSRPQLNELLLNLNSMSSYRVNLAKVLNKKNNKLQDIRKMLAILIDESMPLQRRMSDCSRMVFALKKASIQELVGFYYAGKYPLRNSNTNAGMRYLGYNVRLD